MAAVPKDSYLLLTVFAVVFMMYYLATRGINEMPPGFEALNHPDQDTGGVGGSSHHALNGMELLRNPKKGPRVDHNIKGPIYNFNIPGLSEGWITLPADQSRVYKITVTPLGQVPEPSPTVLLLHASQYSPYAWVETGLLFQLRDNGFRAVAVDLPGHHASNHLPKLTQEQEHYDFISSILQGEHLDKAVILAPEGSAFFVLPLVKRRKEEDRSLRSLILVSPQHGFNYSTIITSTVETLLITGEFEHEQIKRYTSPHIEHLVMPLSANFFFVENSKQFNKIVIDYLKRLTTHDEKEARKSKNFSSHRVLPRNIEMPADL